MSDGILPLEPGASSRVFSLVFLPCPLDNGQPLGIELPKWEGRVIEARKSVVRFLPIAMPASSATIGEKGYDADSLRDLLEHRGTAAVILTRNCRNLDLPFDTGIEKDRNVIERMVCRFKDYRRIATRYDRRVQHFLAALCLVAALCY